MGQALDRVAAGERVGRGVDTRLVAQQVLLVARQSPRELSLSDGVLVERNDGEYVAAAGTSREPLERRADEVGAEVVVFRAAATARDTVDDRLERTLVPCPMGVGEFHPQKSQCPQLGDLDQEPVGNLHAQSRCARDSRKVESASREMARRFDDAGQRAGDLERRCAACEVVPLSVEGQRPNARALTFAKSDDSRGFVEDLVDRAAPRDERRLFAVAVFDRELSHRHARDRIEIERAAQTIAIDVTAVGERQPVGQEWQCRFGTRESDRRVFDRDLVEALLEVFVRVHRHAALARRNPSGLDVLVGVGRKRRRFGRVERELVESEFNLIGARGQRAPGLLAGAARVGAPLPPRRRITPCARSASTRIT